MAAMILCVLVMLALCVLKLVKRTDYRRESDYFYENNLDEYGENEAYTSEYIDYSKAYQPKWLFSYNEKAFYHKLKTFADRNGLFLFAKVRLLDLVEPRRGQQKYKTYFLGMLPLVFASGPGSASRQGIGTGVFFGMLVAITVGIVFVPLFFVWVYKLKEKWTTR